ncbi:MAG TPA: Trm112 family protein [Terriglobales bacterium]|nr:Trm112 family protein [Terriglobales bacterium]
MQTGLDPARIPAMISQDLLDMLVCPVCRKPLNLKDNGQALKCGVCRRVYPIQDDIPVLLLDEAKIDPA